MISCDYLYLTVRGDVDCVKMYDANGPVSGAEIELSATLIKGEEIKVGDDIYYKKRMGFPTAEISLSPKQGFSKCTVLDVKQSSSANAYFKCEKAT